MYVWEVVSPKNTRCDKNSFMICVVFILLQRNTSLYVYVTPNDKSDLYLTMSVYSLSTGLDSGIINLLVSSTHSTSKLCLVVFVLYCMHFCLCLIVGFSNCYHSSENFYDLLISVLLSYVNLSEVLWCAKIVAPA